MITSKSKTKQISKVGSVLLVLGGVVLTACFPGEEREAKLDWDSIHEIVENLRSAGYPDNEIQVNADGTVMVGGDAHVSLQASREMVTEENAVFHYRTNNLVAATVENICIDGSDFTGTLSNALNNSINNYNSRQLTFEMTRTTGDGPDCDALITANQIGGSGGSAGFPASGLPYDTINIGSGVAGYGVDVATHVITHELGHCIGLRHTDYYNRSISCGAGGNEGQAGIGAVHIPNTPSNAVYDGSIMNSCYNAGSTGEWTASDMVALNELYGTGSNAVVIGATYTLETFQHTLTLRCNGNDVPYGGGYRLVAANNSTNVDAMVTESRPTANGWRIHAHGDNASVPSYAWRVEGWVICGSSSGREVQTSSTSTVNTFQHSRTASCSAGKLPVGGGFRLVAANNSINVDAMVTESRPLSNGWRIHAHGDNASAPSYAWRIEAYTICSNSVTGREVKTSSTSTVNTFQLTRTTTCSAGKFPYSGGYRLVAANNSTNVDAMMTESRPTGNGWRTHAHGDNAAAPSYAWRIEAYLVCGFAL